MNKAAMNMNFHRANKGMTEAIEELNTARGLVLAANLAEGCNQQALQQAHERLESATSKLYSAASLAGSIACAVELELN